jgi:hypothetical protein
MGFSMPACVKIPEATKESRFPAPACGSWMFLLLAALFLAACSDPVADGRFEMSQVEARWTNGWMEVTCEQRLSLSNEARNALIHGVPLTVELELLLREAVSRTQVGNETSSYEIRYLPMSNHFQLSLSGGSTVKTFPRLRHVLADLSRLKVSFETGALPAGDYELLARMSMDQQKMPPPMRIPVLLSSKWRHDSAWSSWPLEIEPGA